MADAIGSAKPKALPLLSSLKARQPIGHPSWKCRITAASRPFTPKIFDPGQLLRTSSSQEADRSPILAIVNFRPAVQQFDCQCGRPHWAEPPLVRAEAHATLCATGARS